MQKHIIGLMLALVIGMIGVQMPVQASSPAEHTVKNGDTLWDIAEANEVSVDDLFTWNELTSPLIFPEQEIKIESTYIVKTGDTLSAIAQAHNIKLEDLIRWNSLSNHLIYPGEELALNGEKAAIVTAKNSENNNANKTASPPPAEKKTPRQAAAPPPKENTKNETKSNENTEAKSKVNTETQTTSAPSGKEMTVTATAYTAFCEGCSGITYTGIDLRANPNQRVIAVDPNIIPLGSRVWVEGYGEAIAGDIGGAIKGNIIDVFIENQQDALNWGRRTVTIKILD